MEKKRLVTAINKKNKMYVHKRPGKECTIQPVNTFHVWSSTLALLTRHKPRGACVKNQQQLDMREKKTLTAPLCARLCDAGTLDIVTSTIRLATCFKHRSKESLRIFPHDLLHERSHDLRLATLRQPLWSFRSSMTDSAART